jgi:predicted NBD/HSP70 family sugar kinase
VHVLPADQTSVRAVAQAVAAAVHRMTAEMPDGMLLGLGLSVPGTVRTTGGTVEVAPNLGWQQEPFGALLADLLPGLPVTLANDADMGALAEHVRGAARGSDDVVYLTGKVGVGAGIIVHGQPLRGFGGLAGEIGHTVIDRDGPPCHCGGRGCVEQLVGEHTLLRLAGREGHPDPEAVAAVFAAARAGDRRAAEGIATVAASLGLVLANVVNLVNPQVVVLGGALADVFSSDRDAVLRTLDAQAMAAARAMVDVRVSALQGDSSLLGAAELVFDTVLADPLVLPRAGIS